MSVSLYGVTCVRVVPSAIITYRPTLRSVPLASLASQVFKREYASNAHSHGNSRKFNKNYGPQYIRVSIQDALKELSNQITALDSKLTALDSKTANEFKDVHKSIAKAPFISIGLIAAFMGMGVGFLELKSYLDDSRERLKSRGVALKKQEL